MTKILAGLLAASAIVTAGQASAATDTASMQVTATVVNTCDFTSTGAIAFDTIDPTNAKNADQTFVITCTAIPTTPTVKVDGGLNAVDATSANRAMSDGNSHYLSYTLSNTLIVSDIAILDNATLVGSVPDKTFTGHLYAQTVPVLHASATGVPDGNYTDTLILTLSYTAPTP